jgi:hypothetical protein
MQDVSSGLNRPDQATAEDEAVLQSWDRAFTAATPTPASADLGSKGLSSQAGIDASWDQAFEAVPNS